MALWFSLRVKKEWPASCNYFLKEKPGGTMFLTQGHQNVNLSTEARWYAWFRCNCSRSYYNILKDCKAYLPMPGKAETPSLILTCAVTFTGYYVIWKYWLMPKSISVPCNAVGTKICPCSWVRNTSYCRTVECCLYQDPFMGSLIQMS